MISGDAINYDKWHAPKPFGISGCFRLRNETQFMKAAVYSFLPYLDEAVLVVQPSDDNTVELALKMQSEHPDKIRVYHYPHIVDWIDTPGFYNNDPDKPGHLVHMSNYALSKCSYSWICKIEGDVIALPTMQRLVDKVKADPEGVHYYGMVILNLAGKNFDKFSKENPRNGGYDEAIFNNDPDQFHFVRHQKWETINTHHKECMGWAGIHLKRCKRGKTEGWNGETYLPLTRENLADALTDYNDKWAYPADDNPLGSEDLFDKKLVTKWFGRKKSLHNQINEKINGRIALSPTESKLIIKYAGLKGDYLEIGCLWGATAILAALSKVQKGVDGHIYTVDSMEDDYWVNGDPSSGKNIPTLEKVYRNINTFGVEDRITVFRGKSNPLPLAKGVKPRVAFIDGDHSFEGCLLDWMNVKALQPDYILIHDYKAGKWPGVEKAINYILNNEHEWKQVTYQDTIIVFKRVKSLTPTVSVIVPTYNRPVLLERALTSIDNQLFQDYEIVVVNDAGEDIRDVVERHKKTVLVEHTENKGLPASRNTGIRAAKGKYITFLDDDDVIYPNHFRVLVKAMEAGANLAYTAAYTWDNDQELTKRAFVEYDKKRLHRGGLFPVMCAMVRRELFEIEMFDEELISHEDYDLWIRLSNHIDFTHIKAYTAAYSKRSDPDRISNKDYHINYLWIVKEKHGLLNPPPLPKKVVKGICALILQSVVVDMDRKSVQLTKDDHVDLPKELAAELRRAGYVQY